MDQFGGAPEANQQDIPQHTEAQNGKHLTRQRVEWRFEQKTDIVLKLGDHRRGDEHQNDVNERPLKTQDRSIFSCETNCAKEACGEKLSAGVIV